ncbi:hypothetical protein Z517_08606 [Fonsecaea pedrosoi CBS 271.37]|uniref:Unplaced genomic scaffold supercont1.5, whole genome shotgun sequence n=1 Tax=Fonsecaea pedrosoi CBS 271.37 TaxID=1442368 RepID=A0A0D2EX49_9EURO|nr:uncharacterized protein Z517_08606 [Fonsecaea pedrosoi CBS 271.37]KIW78767.1 hypothetical protein Z517_08606 [Fonsecaea pedrosoi CBS 271.37]
MRAIQACWMVFSLLLRLAISSKTCYTPAGEDTNGPYSTPQNSTYQPCNPTDGTVSMCCASWDTCMPNGLCWNEAYHIWWRESCTDPDFTDPNCVKLFTNITGDTTVSNCTDGSWCVGTKGGCCSDHTGVFLAANNDTLPVTSTAAISASPTPTVSASSTSSLLITTTIASSSTTPSSIASEGSHSLSAGAKAGVGIATAVAVSMLLGLLYLFVRRRQNKRKQLRTGSDNLLPAESKPDRAEIFSTPVFEKDGSRLKTRAPAEMEG